MFLSLSDKEKPKICFLATASGDAEGYIDRFYESYKTLYCEASHFSVFKPHTTDVESFLLEQDIIHVGGGNTLNLLCLWKEWELDRIFKKGLKQGLILSGMSAGMICWFEEGTTDSKGIGLEPITALGFLKGSACPHYDGEPLRRPHFKQSINEKVIKPGLALDDGAGALFENGALSKVVSSRPNAKAYQVEAGNEKELNINYLED